MAVKQKEKESSATICTAIEAIARTISPRATPAPKKNRASAAAVESKGGDGVDAESVTGKKQSDERDETLPSGENGVFRDQMAGMIEPAGSSCKKNCVSAAAAKSKGGDLGGRCVTAAPTRPCIASHAHTLP